MLLDDAAVASFLDSSVTKFLEESEDGIAVTKYMEAEDGIAVTKYLSGTPTYNTFPGNAESNKNNVNMTIIQFLEDKDISVTKFLQQNANVTQT